MQQSYNFDFSSRSTIYKDNRLSVTDHLSAYIQLKFEQSLNSNSYTVFGDIIIISKNWIIAQIYNWTTHTISFITETFSLLIILINLLKNAS